MARSDVLCLPPRTDVYALDEGEVSIRYPSALSADSVRDFEDHMRLLFRRLRRAAGMSPQNKDVFDADH